MRCAARSVLESETMMSRVKAPSLLAAVLVAGACVWSCGVGSAEPWSPGEAPVGDDDAAAGAAGSPDGDSAAATPPVDHVEVTDVAFFVTDQGPRTLIRGQRPRGADLTLRVELLDAAGNAAILGPDGAGAAQPTELEVEVVAHPDSESFFEVIESVCGLEQLVRAVAVTARDASGRAGQRRIAALAPLQVRAEGEPCDAQGFDVCVPGAVCAPGEVDATNRCASAAATRASRCAAAPMLVLGGAPVAGRARGASLWDPPEGCASAERRARPDAAVRLRVPVKTASVTLATDSPGTDFDTVVYVLEGCPASSSQALACNDDDAPPASKVVLHDVAPGDYLVVVDALTREGGSFVLRATAP